jgi:hypothetical protein
MTLGADPAAANRRRTLARVVNLGVIYALFAAFTAALLWAGAPAWTLVGAFIVVGIASFLYDGEDPLDRMFWTQIAHGWHARALMRKTVRRLPVDPCPPPLLAAVRRFDQHANPIFIAEAGGDKLAVLDWTTWDQPDQDYYCLIAVDAAGAMNAMTFFSRWPKAWGSLRWSDPRYRDWTRHTR